MNVWDKPDRSILLMAVRRFWRAWRPQMAEKILDAEFDRICGLLVSRLYAAEWPLTAATIAAYKAGRLSETHDGHQVVRELQTLKAALEWEARNER